MSAEGVNWYVPGEVLLASTTTEDLYDDVIKLAVSQSNEEYVPTAFVASLLVKEIPTCSTVKYAALAELPVGAARANT